MTCPFHAYRDQITVVLTHKSYRIFLRFLLLSVVARPVKLYIPKPRFCPGVRVHKGITIVLSLFTSHWLAVVCCLVLCSGSCEPVHENRT